MGVLSEGGGGVCSRLCFYSFDLLHLANGEVSECLSVLIGISHIGKLVLHPVSSRLQVWIQPKMPKQMHVAVNRPLPGELGFKSCSGFI